MVRPGRRTLDMVKKDRLICTWLCVGLAAAFMAGCGAAGGSAEADNSIQADENTEADDTAGADDEAVAGADENSSGEDTTGQSASEVVKEEVTFEGLGLSVLGDSISTFDGWIPSGFHVFYPLDGEVTDVSQTWWMMLLEDTGMELCANNSSSGSLCAGDSLAEDGTQYACSTFRLSFLTGKQGKMPDIIIIYMGTNDLLNGIPIGENDGTKIVEEGEIENFSDAYSLMLDKLASDYPVSQIYCCTLAQVGEWGTTQPFEMFENGIGLTSEDYSDCIRTIAENKGIPVIDLYNCGIEIDNLQDMTSDGVHLNPEGMKHVERAVISGIGATADE